MAELIIQVPDDIVQRVLDGFANKNGWTPEMGINKVQFLKKKLIEYIKNDVRFYEEHMASITASQQARDDFNSKVVF